MFGLSFGNSDQKTTTNTSGTSATTGTQTQNQTQSGTQNNTSATTGTQNSQSTGSQTTQQQSGQTTQQQQTSQSFSSDILNQLQSAVQGLFGTNAGNGTAAGVSNGALTALSNFDPTQFVQSAVGAAKQQAGLQANTSLNQVKQSVGGTDNSMTALLQQAINSQAASTVTDAQNRAETTAQGIMQNTAQTANQANTAQASILDNLLTALKGGQTTTAGTGATATTSSGATQTAENTQQASASNTNAMTTFTQLLNSLLGQNSVTNSNQTSMSDTSKGSTGFSFGL